MLRSANGWNRLSRVIDLARGCLVSKVVVGDVNMETIQTSVGINGSCF
jgi:hypothetical protein